MSSLNYSKMSLVAFPGIKSYLARTPITIRKNSDCLHSHVVHYINRNAFPFSMKMGSW